MPPKPQGKGMRSKRVIVTFSLAKWVRKAVGCKQAPVAFTQALDESLTEVDPISGQDSVFQQLEMMMTVLADLTSRVKANENQVSEKVR